MRSGNEVSVSFTLENTGSRSGAEVAQVYAGTLPTSVPTPPKQLAGWAKVSLDPGESRRVTVRLACKSLSYWDPGTKTYVGQIEGAANVSNPNSTDPASQNTDGHWVTPSGRVTLSVGSSVQDIRLTDAVTLRAGTCAENSDIAGGSGGGGGGGGGTGGGGGAAGPPGPPGSRRSGRRVQGPAGPPGLPVGGRQGRLPQHYDRAGALHADLRGRHVGDGHEGGSHGTPAPGQGRPDVREGQGRAQVREDARAAQAHPQGPARASTSSESASAARPPASRSESGLRSGAESGCNESQAGARSRGSE